MGFGIKKDVTANVTPSTIVYFDKATPTEVGVVFTPNTPATTDVLYVSSVDASTWIWDGLDYITYSAPSTSSTEWYLFGTTIDAGSNKTATIQRSGAIYVNADSYFNGVIVGRGSGNVSNNTVVGDKALISNSTGSQIVALGYGALQNNSTGSNNSAIGWGALANNSTGSGNGAFGNGALQSNITGSNSSAIGYQAGRFLGDGTTANITPQNSVFLGYGTKSLTNNDTNQIVIGYNAIGKGSNTVQLGNSSITDTYLQGAVTFNNAYKLPTTAPTSGQVLGYLGAGTTQWTTAGLSYFSEAQSTTAPNATVPVDSLTAVTGTTNGDFAILPKGTGAFIVGHIPDGSIANGGKRGAGAVEIRSAESMNYYAGATGINSISIGKNTQSTQTGSVAIGLGCSATGAGAIALGNGNDVGASGAQSTAIQGGSSATNTLSFAIQGGVASGAGSLAGYASTASGTYSVALGGVAFEGCTASGIASFAVGQLNLANARNSIALGCSASTKGVVSRLSIGCYENIGTYVVGSSQSSISSTVATTTTNTSVELLALGSAAIALVLQNNEAIRVKGSIIGKQTATTNVTSYDFDCVIVRGTTAASTVIKVSNMNLVWDDIVCTVLPTLSVNTGLGGLSVKSGGKLTTTIKWSCRIDSTESILA